MSVIDNLLMQHWGNSWGIAARLLESRDNMQHVISLVQFIKQIRIIPINSSFNNKPFN